jgi:hypothetical protein
MRRTRDKERREAQETARGVIGDQVVRQLRDGDDEDEIEEELEPARVTLALVGQRSQARRTKPGRAAVSLWRVFEANPHPLHSLPRRNRPPLRCSDRPIEFDTFGGYGDPASGS